MLNDQIQTYQMVFMNFWYIKHYGARVEVIFLLVITNLKYQMDIQSILIINRRILA